MSQTAPPNRITLAYSLERRAALTPSRPALTDEDGSWSYGELERRVEQLAAIFAEGGVGEGDRVAYLGLNRKALIAALFAAARLGAIFLPLNFRLTPRELSFIVGDAGVHTILVDSENAAKIDATRSVLPCRRYLAVGQARDGWSAVDALLDREHPAPPAALVGPDDVALLMYTSGTTGMPKGAMLTHGNLWANAENWMLSSDLRSTDVGLNVAPLFHVGGLCVALLPILYVGGHAVIQRQFEPASFLAAIERHHVTVTFAVPAMMLFASQHERFADADLSSLRLVVCGGAPAPEMLLRLYGDRGIPVSHCYGMTETTCAATFLETENAIAKLGSCGRPGMLCEVRIVDFDGRVVTDPGTKGQIEIRGPIVTKGYWNRPDATAEAIDPDGWLKSGDVGYPDADGFLYVCDRVKDMIISGGENVYPAEVESALYEHPAIAEVAVVGAADERWGERVVAVVAPKPAASITLEDLQAFARERLAGYKIPRELRVVAALPRNANGKVVKSELRGGATKPA